MRVHILNAKDYSKEALELYSTEGYVISDGLTPPEDTDILLTRLESVDAQMIASLPQLKAVGANTTGHDHVDTAALLARDIPFINLVGHADFMRTITSTAEHTMGLLLALARRYPTALQYPHHPGTHREEYRGIELAGKCLGLIGYGRVGQQVARRAQAFGMVVRYYDPAHPDGSVGSLTYLLGTSDIISIHVPLGDSTRSMFVEDTFLKTKEDAYLINTSRGAILERGSLLLALKNNWIKAAAIDVMNDEKEGGEEDLLEYARENPDRLIITGHIAGCTLDAMQKTEAYLAKLIVEWGRDIHGKNV